MVTRCAVFFNSFFLGKTTSPSPQHSRNKNLSNFLADNIVIVCDFFFFAHPGSLLGGQELVGVEEISKH